MTVPWLAGPLDVIDDAPGVNVPFAVGQRSADVYSADFDSFGSALGLATNEQVLGISGDFAVAMWIKLTSAPPGGGSGLIRLDNEADGVDRIIISFQNATNFRVEVRNNGGSILSRRDYTSPFTVGEWYHCVFLIGGDTDFYKDGSLVTPDADLSGSGVIADSSRHLVVGANTSAGATPWQGRIYDLAIWSSHLTSDEIATIRNGGAPKNVDLTVDHGDYASSSDLTNWWRFGENSNKGATNLGSASLDLTESAAQLDEILLVNDYPS